jgi:hypothetical protein
MVYFQRFFDYFLLAFLLAFRFFPMFAWFAAG